MGHHMLVTGDVHWCVKCGSYSDLGSANRYLRFPCHGRPETERLVDVAVDRIKNLSNPKVLEIGTGTGCISIAIGSAKKDATILSLVKLTFSSEIFAVSAASPQLNFLGCPLLLNNFDPRVVLSCLASGSSRDSYNAPSFRA